MSLNENNLIIHTIKEYEFIPNFKNIKKIHYGYKKNTIDITSIYKKKKREELFTNNMITMDPCPNVMKEFNIYIENYDIISDRILSYKENDNIIIPTNLNIIKVTYGYNNTVIDITDLFKEKYAVNNNNIYFNLSHINNIVSIDPCPNVLKNINIQMECSLNKYIYNPYINNNRYDIYLNLPNHLFITNILYLFIYYIANSSIIQNISNIFYYLTVDYNDIKNLVAHPLFKRVRGKENKNCNIETNLFNIIWEKEINDNTNKNIIYINFEMQNNDQLTNYNYYFNIFKKILVYNDLPNDAYLLNMKNNLCFDKNVWKTNNIHINKLESPLFFNDNIDTWIYSNDNIKPIIIE